MRWSANVRWEDTATLPATLRDRVNRILTGLVLLALLAGSCGDAEQGALREARGGKRYGGVFNANETEILRSIFPLSLSQASAHRIAAQIYQGLVRLDPLDLSIRPCIAERWEVDPTATEYTFHLRQDVFFHDDPVFADKEDRRVDAYDVLECFKAICTDDRNNQMFWLFQDQVVGANAYFAATSEGEFPEEGVVGLQVIDGSTFRISLVHPMPNFLQVLAHQGCWIWPRELMDAYGNDLMTHAIGTGPFRMKVHVPEEALVLERDPDHWATDEHGNRLPFLDAVRFTFEPEKEKELDRFLDGHISCVFEPPVGRVDVLNDSVDPGSGERRFVVQSVPALTVQFYGFNASRWPFDDPLVRAAFSLAMDRRTIVDSVLQGLAVPAEHGLVAPGIAGYPYQQVTGHHFAPDSARKLLAQAGYPGGKGLPSVILNVNTGGFGYIKVAEAVQDMLQRELGVPVTISALPSDSHFEQIESGRALFWREGWLADVPDPENFLALLYGKNAEPDTALPTFLNTTRFIDPTFDSLFASAQRSVDPTERLSLFAQAEDVAMSAFALTPIYHERSVRLLRPEVRDMPINSMEYRDLGAVWFAKDPDGSAKR
ncbi:MAG: ABC transporter substrate-binding protein [Flavobacteriales bacterium]|nr:ABC transporter substrate-binding protein [Flavobacteriales bacterium]